MYLKQEPTGMSALEQVAQPLLLKRTIELVLPVTLKLV